MVDSRLRGSDVVVRPMNYPKAKRSGKLLTVPMAKGSNTMEEKNFILLVNPWIHDFAAYDLWSKPLGLLIVAAGLRKAGYEVSLIDCLDVYLYHPDMLEMETIKPPKRRQYGTGKFWKQAIEKPPALEHIDRTYSRYGIHPEVFKNELIRYRCPAAILITSLMTYWYPGVFEAIRIAKEVYPEVPIILGGIYARLCVEHARAHSGAHYVLQSSDMPHLLGLLKDLGIEPNPRRSSPALHPYPAFDLIRKPDYVCILSSTGCPYRCRYCASHYLFPRFWQRDPEEVFQEISYWHQKRGVKDFAFYDDALLVNPRQHFIPLMEKVLASGLGVRFHTPNAIHIREVTAEIAAIMKAAGFITLRIGLETADFSARHNLDNKLAQGEFERGVRHLFDAGFHSSQIGAYILVGLPGQSVESVSSTIDFVAENRVMPYLAEYSPLPHTQMWAEAVSASQYDIEKEPLYHNNTLLPCWDESERARMDELKQKVKEARENVRG